MPRSPHDLLKPLLPSPKSEGRRRQFSDRLEDLRRSLPQPLERTCRFATAAQWARIDRRRVQRSCEGPRGFFGLPLASRIEPRICVLSPAGGGTGVSDQIEFRHGNGRKEFATGLHRGVAKIIVSRERGREVRSPRIPRSPPRAQAAFFLTSSRRVRRSSSGARLRLRSAQSAPQLTINATRTMDHAILGSMTGP
jgi:hypothetical protein